MMSIATVGFSSVHTRLIHLQSVSWITICTMLSRRAWLVQFIDNRYPQMAGNVNSVASLGY